MSELSWSESRSSALVRRALATCVLTLVAVLLPVTGAVSGAGPARAAEPLKIMIIGDSVTQGSSGDFTWRYRLWKHLDATTTAPFDFVGPRDDLWDRATDTYGDHDYADPAFDQDHASKIGMSLAFPEFSVSDLMAQYEPDVITELMGVIDLVYYHRTPEAIALSVTGLVSDARAANPNVTVVVGEIPQTWFAGVPEVNTALRGVVAALDQPGARVVLAPADPAYQDGTYDGSHADAMGEQIIAASFGDALASVGIGTPTVRPLPSVPLGPRRPAVVTSAVVVDGKAAVAWSPPPGSWSTRVETRDPSGGAGWVVAEDALVANDWSTALSPGSSIQVRLLPRKGNRLAQADMYSAPVTLTALRLPGRPVVAVTKTGTGKVRVSWRSARSESYRVELRKKGHGGWRSMAVPPGRTRLVLRGLRSHGKYAVRVTGLNTSGAGPTSRGVRFTAP